MLQRCARMRYCARSTLTSISTVSFPTEWASTSSSTAFVSTAGLRYASAGAQRHLDDNPCLDRSQRRSVGLKFFSRGYAVQATAKPRVNEEVRGERCATRAADEPNANETQMRKDCRRLTPYASPTKHRSSPNSCGWCEITTKGSRRTRYYPSLKPSQRRKDLGWTWWK